MSKELHAELHPQEILHTDTRTDGWLLTRVASKVDQDPHKLRRFADLLGIDDDTYCRIKEKAESNEEGIPLNVSVPSVIASEVIFTKKLFLL